MLNDKLTKDIAEVAKGIMATGYTVKEVEAPRAKGEKDFLKLHGIQVVDDPEQDPENVRGKQYTPKMAEGKMKDLQDLVKKGVKDPKKIAKELGLPITKDVLGAIDSLVKGM
tara:strand:+ start:5266 stop:5601 length:336 start_codon:yes stop_codon:yes gene_type:complete